MGLKSLVAISRFGIDFLDLDIDFLDMLIASLFYLLLCLVATSVFYKFSNTTMLIFIYEIAILALAGNTRTYLDAETLPGSCLLSAAHDHGGY